MRPFALLAALALAACSTQPDTLPNPYVSMAQARVRVLGVPEAASPFAEAVAAALVRRGFTLEPVAGADGAAFAGPYADYGLMRALQARGVDGVLSVAAALGMTGGPSGASAAVVSTVDGAVIASADWRPRLGAYLGPSVLRRSAGGPIAQTDLLVPVADQLADALAAQIDR